MEPFETFEHDGITVEIHYDEDGGDHGGPRDADNLTTMVCWHPDYVLGDEQFVSPDGRGAVEPVPGEQWYVARDQCKLRPTSMEHLQRYLTLMRKAIHVRPLYLLDHSGLSLRCGSASPFDPGGWDTTMVGFIYTTHERVTELCGDGEKYHSDEWLAEQVEQDVRIYDDHLRGCYYGFVVAPGTADEDSCWDFLGDPDAEGGCKDEAKAVAAYIAKERAELRALPWLPTFGNPIMAGGAR